MSDVATNQNALRPVLIGALALVAVGALFFVFGDVFTGAIGTLSDGLPYVAGVLLVCWGLWKVDKALVAEEMAKPSSGDRRRLIFALRASLVLSGVSFLTTLFGMFNFVSGSGTSLGQTISGWAISVGTTFGIQVILFVVSLTLGERLVALRPRFDDSHNRALSNAAGRGAREHPESRFYEMSTKVIGLVSVTLLLLLAISAFGIFSLKDLWEAIKGLINGEAESQAWLGVAFILIAIALARFFGLMRSLWTPMILSFLFIVYLGSLAVSALFSFDSYYQIFQSDEDAMARRGAIVREETSAKMQIANNAFIIAMDDLRDGDVADRLNAEVEIGIDRLIQSASELEGIFQTAFNDRIVRNQERNAQIDTQISALNDQLDSAIAAVVSVATDRSQVEAVIASITDEQDVARTRLENARTQRRTIQDTILSNRARANCEEQGLTEGICEGSSGIPDCGTRCRAWKAEADRLEQVDLIRAEQAIAQAEEELEQLSGRLEAQRLNQLAGSTSPEDDQARVAQIRARFQAQIDALEQSRPQLQAGAQETSGAFDVTTLRTNYAEFISNPGDETLNGFVSTCRDVRDTLLGEGVTDIQNFECQPASMVRFAQQATRIMQAEERFNQQCGDGTDDPLVAQSSTGGAGLNETDTALNNLSAPSDDLQDLRALVEQTRRCLEIANVGPATVRDAVSDLTEIISTYLGESSDMRRSIEDFRRASPFAVGAASGAVFIDMLILFIGFLVAMTRPSSLYDNPLDPEIQQIENNLNRIAAHYAPDNKTATGMRIFMSYLEERYIDPSHARDGAANPENAFRYAIDTDAVQSEHKQLVKAILSQIPLRYRQTKDFQPLSAGPNADAVPRTTINQAMVSLISGIAHDAEVGESVHQHNGPVGERSWLTRWADSNPPPEQNTQQNTTKKNPGDPF